MPNYKILLNINVINVTYLLYTVVGDNINIMKTTFERNFDLYQAFKQHGYTKRWKQREAVNFKLLLVNL